MIAVNTPPTGSNEAQPGAEAARRISELLGDLQRSNSEFTGQVRGAQDQEGDQKENQKSWGEAWKTGRAVVADWNKFIGALRGSNPSLADRETLAVTGALLATGIQDLFLLGKQRGYSVKGSNFANRVESILQGILKVSFQHTTSAPLSHPQVRDLIKNPVAAVEPPNPAQSSLERFAAWYVLSVVDRISHIGTRLFTQAEARESAAEAAADAATALNCLIEKPPTRHAVPKKQVKNLTGMARAQCKQLSDLLSPTK